MFDIPFMLPWGPSDIQTFVLLSFDLFDAFDIVDHEYLISILSNIGVKDRILTVNNTCLKSQTHYVMIDVF